MTVTTTKGSVDAVSPRALRVPDRRRRATAGYPRWTPYLFLLPAILLFAGFTVYPYVSALWLSLTTNRGGETTFAGLANYVRLLRDPLFYTALKNTFVILIVQVPVMLALAVLLAVAFNSVLLKARALWRTIYFVPIVMGLVAYGILFRALFSSQDGFVNQLLGAVGAGPIPWLANGFWAKMTIVIALTWHYTGQSAIIYLAQLQAIPVDLYEAAAADGAGAVQRFWNVTWPGLRPALVLTAILSTIGTLQLFDEPFVLTGGGPNNATLTVGMYLYTNGFRYFDFGYASAIGYALTLIIGAISLIQLRLTREKP
jgi:lactose/L-arabinose transport system permease protein